LSLNQGTLVVSGQTLAYADEDVENDVPIYVRVDSLVRFEHQGDAGGNSALNWKLEANTPAEAFNLRGIANSAISGSLLVATSTNDNYGSATFNFGAATAMRRSSGTWAATQRFVASQPLASNDLAGTSIAVSDDLLVVGAPGYDVGGVVDSGAVHVFRRLSGLPQGASVIAHGWKLAATLVNESPQENGRLGESSRQRTDSSSPERRGATMPPARFGSELRKPPILGPVKSCWARRGERRVGDLVPPSVLMVRRSRLVRLLPALAGRICSNAARTITGRCCKRFSPHAADGRFGAALDLDEADNLIVGSPDASVNGAQAGEACIYRREETASGRSGSRKPIPAASSPVGTRARVSRLIAAGPSSVRLEK